MGETRIHYQSGWRSAAAIADGSRWVAFLFFGWQSSRLQHNLPQLPDVEALHGRTGAIHHSLRSQKQHQRRRAAYRLHRYIPNVAWGQDLFLFRSGWRSSLQPLQLRSWIEKGRTADAL